MFNNLIRTLKKLLGIKVMPSGKKPESVDIDVNVTWPSSGDPCGVTFELEPQNGGKIKVGKQPGTNKDYVKFENQGSPGFFVFFNIVEKGGSGCQFVPNPRDAMWVQPSDLPDPPCPTSVGHWDQFEALEVISQNANKRNKTLMVHNKNEFAKMFAFTLRFAINGCPTVVEFDPIGDNANGFRF